MKPLKKIAGYNLLAILIYSVLIHFAAGRDDTGIMVYSAFVVGTHVLVAFLCSLAHFASREKELGRAWLLSTGLVLLVGFSACLGNSAL